MRIVVCAVGGAIVGMLIGVAVVDLGQVKGMYVEVVYGLFGAVVGLLAGLLLGVVLVVIAARRRPDPHRRARS